MSQVSTPYAFLSYSRLDQGFAAHLARDLRVRGIHLWFDQLDIPPGRNWDAAIHEALHGASAVLFLVSAHSVTSENVLNEITVALDAKKWVIPLMLADVPVPLRIARLQRVNFSADYAAALNHLTAHMRGYGSRTTALEAILTSPGASAANAQAPQRSSLSPVHHASAPPATKRPWLLPAMAGLGVGVVGLFVLLLLIGTSDPDSPPASPSQGGNSSGSASAPPTASAPAPTIPQSLQGTWKGDCVDYGSGVWGRMSMTLLSSTVASGTDYSSNAACSDPLYALSLTYDVVSVTSRGPQMFAVDCRIQKLAIVPITSAAALNREAVLNMRQWRDGEPMDLSRPLAQQVLGYPYQPGMQVYDLLGIDEGGVLHKGKDAGTHAALSPDERPVELEAQGYTRVEP